MLSFYSGAFTSREIDEMPVDEYEQYFNAIRIIESRQILNGFVVADWPHLKGIKRQEIHRRFTRQVSNDKSNVANSTEELARMLGAIDGRK